MMCFLLPRASRACSEAATPACRSYHAILSRRSEARQCAQSLTTLPLLLTTALREDVFILQTKIRELNHLFLFSISCISSVCSYCTFALCCFSFLSPLASLFYLLLSLVCCPGNKYPSPSQASLLIGAFF